MNKKLIIFIIIIVLAAISIFYFPAKKKNESGLVLILDYGNSRKQTFQLSTNEQKRAWSILQEVAAVSNIDLEATNDFYPKKIDGLIDGNDNKHWTFYVNEIKQNLSPIEVFVKPPAEVLFRFE